MVLQGSRFPTDSFRIAETNQKQIASAWMVEYNAPDRSETLQAGRSGRIQL